MRLTPGKLPADKFEDLDGGKLRVLVMDDPSVEKKNEVRQLLHRHLPCKLKHDKSKLLEQGRSYQRGITVDLLVTVVCFVKK
jgi:hypothetical protein